MKKRFYTIGAVIASSLLLSGCAKIEDQFLKIKGLIKKEASANTQQPITPETISSEPTREDSKPSTQEDKSIIFACLSKNQKFIKVSTKAGLINYEFGTPGNAPEISLSVTPEKAAISLWNGVGRYESYSIGFSNGDTNYSVFWSQDKQSEASGLEAGVHVERNGEIIATVSCNSTDDIFYDVNQLVHQTTGSIGAAEANPHEKLPYRLPKLTFEETILFDKLRANGVESFHILGIQSYLENPKIYWENCVSGYAETSKQSGGYGEVEAQNHGEQVCQSKANDTYACLNDLPIKSAASCLQRNWGQETANAD